MDNGVYVGNAGKDAALDRGWLLGYFKDVDDPRHSEAVEIKWGVHPRGDKRARWVESEERTALLVLISGRFRVELPGRSVVLAQQGDYVVWGGVSLRDVPPRGAHGYVTVSRRSAADVSTYAACPPSSPPAATAPAEPTAGP